MSFFSAALHTVLFLFFCIPFAGAQNSSSQSAAKKYSLFHPVHRDKMKKMSTDRPDVTESAYTAEAGHFQVEADLFKHVRNKTENLLNTQNIYNLANFKIGLTENTDIQLVFPTYVNTATHDLNTNKIINKTGGFDDITLRLKYNFWGNSGGKTAFAVLPYISFPTSSFSKNGVQGGILFPFAAEIKEGLSFGTQAAVDIVKEENDHYSADLIYSFTLGKTIFKNADLFAETYTTYSPYNKKADIFLNSGIIYSVTKNLNIDAGFNYGLKKDSDRIFFTGFSWRY